MTTTHPISQQSAESPATSVIRDAILRDLTPSERLLVVLRYAEGLTLAEISAVLNMSQSQIEARIERIIALLTGRASQAGVIGA